MGAEHCQRSTARTALSTASSTVSSTASANDRILIEIIKKLYIFLIATSRLHIFILKFQKIEVR